MALTSSPRGSTSHPARHVQADDRVRPPTRWLAWFVIPFLVAASIILIGSPERSGDLFAWPMKPPMTAMMLGAAYLGGIHFFGCVAFARRWHTVQAGFLPVATFATALGIATILHWDKFTHGHVSFWAWAGLYFVAPFLVIAAWLSNRRNDPGRQPGDVLLPGTIRWVFGLASAVDLVLAVLMFVQPEWMIAAWPWKLSPLTARVLCAVFALPGVLGLVVAADPRWSGMKRILESQALTILFILLATLRDWDSFDHGSVGAPLFAFGMGGFLVGIVVLYVAMQARQRRAGAGAPGGPR